MTTPRNYETPSRQQVQISQVISQQHRPNKKGQPGSKANPRKRETVIIKGIIALLIMTIAVLLWAALAIELDEHGD